MCEVNLIKANCTITFCNLVELAAVPHGNVVKMQQGNEMSLKRRKNELFCMKSASI